MKIVTNFRLALGLLIIPAATAQAAIVFSEIDLVANTITLTNTDSAAVDLGGWRFCSHDVDSVRVYSSPTEFDGISLAGSGSYVVDTTSIPFAGLLGNNVMSIGLYDDLDGSLSFGSPDDLSAFIQFAPVGSTELGNSEFRTNTAIAAGLWDATGSFVEVAPGDTHIVLNDLNSSTGASSFTAVPEPSSALLGMLVGSFFLISRRRK